MTRFWLLLFLTAGHFSYGQSNQPSKLQLINVFKKSIRQCTKDKVSIDSNPWIICNKDSSFYKADTLKLYNNKDYYYRSNCCNFVDWTFYKKDAFVLTETKICQEPTIGTVARNDDWFTIKLSIIDDTLFLETYKQSKAVNKFKVVSIDSLNGDKHSSDATKVVTLVRVK